MAELDGPRLAPRSGKAKYLVVFLHGEVAGRKGVGVAEAEQEIDVGSPRPDAVQRGERRVRRVGIHVADRGQIDVAFRDGFADFAN